MITITFTIEHIHTDEVLGTHTKRFNSLNEAVDYMYASYIKPNPRLPKDSGLESEILDNYLQEIQPIKRKYMGILATDIDVLDTAKIDEVHLV